MADGNRLEGELRSKIVSSILKKFRNDKPFTLPDDLLGARRILVIDSGESVDLLFAAPVVNWFHERHPDIRMTLLVCQEHSDIAKSLMKVNKIITYNRKQLRLLKTDYMALSRKLRKQEMDTVILISRQMTLERHLLAFMSGASARIGFAHPMAYPFVNCEIKVSENTYTGNGMIRILESLGLGVRDCDLKAELPASEIQHAKQLIHFRKPEKDVLTVGIDPGNGKSRHGVVPETIAYLANNLAGRMKVKFLILMDPVNPKLSERLTRELRGDVIDLVPSSRSETLALLAGCDLFLAGNTDLFHFAAAFGVPAVGLFTRHDGTEWVPDKAPNIRIFKGVKGEKLPLKAFFEK
ncbi:MAG TPA: glycosyltransferase family 9 protein, partial [Candidatus Krumholzibacterium sp.]|nr:glycosyltransferase family 9 protein [Candidatus Krumholzibacterium sp.]